MKKCLKISLSVLILLFSLSLIPDNSKAETNHLVINEVRYDVSTASGFSEWVEIYNPTENLVLSEGYKLTDLENEFIFPLGSQIKSKEYVVVAKSLAGFKDEYNLEANYQWSMSLADSGDEVIFRDKNGQDIDAAVYEGKSYGGINPHPGITRPNSMERQPKGRDTDDCAQDFVEQPHPSPFAGLPSAINLSLGNITEQSIEVSWTQNQDSDFEKYLICVSDVDCLLPFASITEQTITTVMIDNLTSGTKYEIKIRVKNSSNGFWDSNVISVLTKKVYSSAIIVNELFPHPSTGTDNEFIELYNSSNEDVDLSNWILDDIEGGSSPYLIPAGIIIKANSYLIFYKKETKISLNDDGDSARLFWPDSILASISGAYKNADYDISWSRNLDGSWSFSTAATPGAANIFTSKQEEIKNMPVLPIEEAKSKPKNNWVKVEGVVTAPPGLFGKRVMYIQDKNGGIKIYFDKALWPLLRIGDRVIIWGKISTSSGEYQIKVYSSDDIIISGHDPPPEPAKKIIVELGDFIGRLLRVSGRVVKISGSTIWIDDGTGELRIYFYPATGIKGLGLKKGDWAVIVGVLSKTSAGLRLLPRAKNDLKIIKTPEHKNIKTTEIVGKVTGAEKAQAAGADYRNLEEPRVAEAKKELNPLGILLVLFGFVSLASLSIFANIREKHGNYN